MNNNNMNFDALGIRPDEWDMLVNVDLEDLIAADHPGQSEEDRIWLQRVIRCIFRGKAATDSGGKRPLIPAQAGH